MVNHDEDHVPNIDIIEPLLTTQECEGSPEVTEYNSHEETNVFPNMETESNRIYTPNGVIREDGK